MATGSATRNFHGTLTATTVDTITINSPAPLVRIANRGTADIFLTLNGTTPTVGGAETLVVPAGQTVAYDTGLRHGPGQWTDYDGVTTVGTANATNFVVKLISSGTPAYSVLTV